jgi:hypothetical protein
MAMEALALKRQQELARARETIAELQEEAAENKPAGEEKMMVELITSPEAANRIFEQLILTAQTEIVSLTRPPMLFTSTGGSQQKGKSEQREAQARGVRFRNIVGNNFMTLPGALDFVREDMEAGEEVRIFPQLPFKMVLVDRRVALIPMSLEQPDYSSLVVRQSALLDALSALFEVLWQQASPIRLGESERNDFDDSALRLPEETVRIMQLLASGLNDKGIVDELGISRRTFTRRLGEVSRAWSIRTRFQLGWFAALRFAKDQLSDKANTPTE